MSDELLTERDKIQILLQEYNTLRSELVSGSNRSFQLLSVGSALFVLIVSRPLDRRFWTAIVASIIALSYGRFITLRDIRRLAKRVRELEHEINRRAGEELLVWESRWGMAATGFYFEHLPLTPNPPEPPTNH
jgi:hypothetical protein